MIAGTTDEKECATLKLKSVYKLLCAVILLTVVPTPVAAEPVVELDVPRIEQRFSPPDRTSMGWDSGKYDCLPASIAMGLQFFSNQGLLPADAVTDYPAIRRLYREVQPDPTHGIHFDVSLTRVPELTRGAVEVTYAYSAKQADGTFEGEVTDEGWQQYVIQQIESGQPIIAYMYDWQSLVNHHGHGRYAHAIVITGLHDGKVIYVDPWDGQRWEMAADDFGKAWGRVISDYYRWVRLSFAVTSQLSPSPQLTATASPPATLISTPVAPPPSAPTATNEIAYVSAEEDIWIADVLTGETDRLTTTGGNSNPAWSFDGRYLLYEHRADMGAVPDLYIFDTQENQTRLFVQQACCGAWSPSDNSIAFLAYALDDYTLETAHIDGSSRTIVMEWISNIGHDMCGCHARPNGPIVWAPDGTFYLPLVWDAEGSPPITWHYDPAHYFIGQVKGPAMLNEPQPWFPDFVPKEVACLFEPALAPDGRSLALTQCSGLPGHGRIIYQDQNGGWQSLDSMTNPSWSPDGRQIAAEFYPDDVLPSCRHACRIYIIDLDTGASTEIGIVGTDPAWRPPGKHE